jgi:hypothetical protein
MGRSGNQEKKARGLDLLGALGNAAYGPTGESWSARPPAALCLNLFAPPEAARSNPQ